MSTCRFSADRIVQTMLQVGLDVMRHGSGADKVATLLCRILLEGLAAVPPTDCRTRSVCGVHRCRRCGEVVD